MARSHFSLLPRSNGTPGSIVGLAAAGLAVVCAEPRAGAQNLLRNASFEWVALNGNYPEGKYSMPSPDVFTIQPWEVLPGGLADIYFPKATGAKSILRTPHGGGVLGFPPIANSNWGVLQTLNPAWSGTIDSGQYLFVADIAGDRGTDTLPRTDTLGCELVVNGSPPAYGFPSVPCTSAGASDPFGNTTRNSVFYPRVVPLNTGNGTWQPINGTLRLWNSGRTGVLVDAAHLIKVYGYRPNCDERLSLMGFSILEDDSWLASPTSAGEPLWDLLQGTTQGCDGCVSGELFADYDALTINSGWNAKSTILLVGYRVPGAPRLTLTLETEGLSANTPAFSVSFYDFAAQKWRQPSPVNQNVGKPYPGGKVGADIRCHTIDWSVYNDGAPLANYAIPSPMGELVLAKVVFQNGCGTWFCPTGQTGGSNPPEPWQFLLHFAQIEFR